MTSSLAAGDRQTPDALDIPGTWNARDVGGRAVPAGATAPLRTGVLVRTASLSRLTPEGVAALEALGVTLDLDLRGADEVERDGQDVVPATTRVVPRPLDPAVGVGHALGGADAPAASGTPGREEAATEERSADTAAMIGRLLGADDPQALARAMMHGVYATFVTDPAIRRTVGEALEDIAEADGAVVVHCSAGKDRTGWIVALVQHVCGVSEEDRLAEYLASGAAVEGLAAVIPPIPGLDKDALTPLLGVEPEYLRGAWELAENEFGSIDGYLDACGAGPATRAKIARKFAAQGV
ncbi:tyrosine-protein phosphatase [Oerskovia paurometabola]|uniref:Tyrosine-protein phosphatase n=1 Tax=Oerskovia paurometabola TaxID=162170 RepID=A0ABW1XG96_9CELL|nr:tyrosine-protein phosphatase [Oerskovia paurometabola]MBM7497464.1 protein-tyrosine phosphatase [Oerskovia paurometabola]